MYPPVAIGQIRINWTQDITLAGRLHLPAGTAVWVPHHAIQNASFNWDEPDKFLPGAACSLCWPASLHAHHLSCLAHACAVERMEAASS